jgi:hypothetical protein
LVTPACKIRAVSTYTTKEDLIKQRKATWQEPGSW